ncbi:hypothetical protein FHS50_002064 [Sphingomicrobium lutaoense]|uniref:PepSY domain-containing protein n=2 Tax=Sphingomicrobium lutaoense TaxID=515949 RepID=A0A839Z5W1_9SPHN|nr:hypothetical protein [Sphingomicrobium lutaoense]MBB3765002.1 hypothetical protein [Sphingomicrobium lutaoense]
MMTRIAFALLAAGMAALAFSPAAQSYAQAQKTPEKWDYEIVDGKRVPKAKRQVNPDGSWREEKRDGKCVEIKEMSAQGELKITRKCDD